MKIFLSFLMMVVSVSAATTSAKAAFIHYTDNIENVAPDITDMYVCGRWKHHSVEGYYRVVYVSFYYGNSLLYVQWVEDPKEPSHRPKLLHTLSINEFNADDHIEKTFEKPQCKESNDGLSFDINASNSEEAYKIRIDIKHEFGKYIYNETVVK